MFFIMGLSDKQDKLDFIQTAICPSCGSYGRIEVYCVYSYFSLFFIPLIKWNRRYFIKMSCCGMGCELDKETGDAIRKGERSYIDPSILNMRHVRCCKNCGYIPHDESFEFCPKCGCKISS